MEMTSGGVRVYYEVYGEGLPIVMLHGWGVDHRILKGCIEPVFADGTRNFKRIYIDLPGMGRTAATDSVRGTDDMRTVLLELIGKLIPGENFLLAGKSYGGYLSRGILHAVPERVAGLCLICPLVFYETQQEQSPERTVLEREGGLEAVIPSEEMEYFDLFHVRQTREVWDRYREHILPGTKLADYAFLENVLGRNKSFTENIDVPGSRFQFPALLLAGRQDWCVGYRDLWRLLEHYERASFVVVDKAGHNLEFEQPEIFRAHFSAWLDNAAEYEARRSVSAPVKKS